jgi:outer membrane protein OmpA-like peptidoglycan-associated protein
MHIEPYGESQPVVPDAETEEEHAQNRRVEVDIVRKND